MVLSHRGLSVFLFYCHLGICGGIYAFFFIKNVMKDLWNDIQTQINSLMRKGNYFCYGKSEMGQKLVGFYFGKGKRKILLQGATHAREYITTLFLLKLCRYLECQHIDGMVVVCPLVNPDGVKISLCGEKSVDKRHSAIIKNILKKCDYQLIKCNARGVDININFDAHWGMGKKNFFGFASNENYLGERPASESETKALVRLTKEFQPDVTLSYHSKGEVIYYGVEGQKLSKLETKLLGIIKRETRYRACKTKDSCGGYKDFCIEKLNIPSFTIEVGNEKLSHPLGISSLNDIFEQNKDVILKLLKCINDDFWQEYMR